MQPARPAGEHSDTNDDAADLVYYSGGGVPDWDSQCNGDAEAGLLGSTNDSLDSPGSPTDTGTPRGPAQQALVNDEESGFDDEKAALMDGLMRRGGNGGGSGIDAGGRGWPSPFLAGLGQPRLRISPLLVRSVLRKEALHITLHA